jgi:hypothetical protein
VGKLGGVTAFAAEASLWIAGAAMVAGAAGAHWNMPSVDVGALIAQSWPGASSSLVKNFTSRITASDFQASGPVAGTMTVTAASQKLDGTFAGAIKLSGKDSSLTLTTSMTGSKTTTETVSVGDSDYERTNGGKWTRSARSSTGLDISSFLSAGSLTDKGVQSHGGRQLHRLETGKPLDPKTVGFGDSSMSNPKFTLTFWAKDDGSPAGMMMAGTWTQAMSGAAANATMSLDFNFEKLSGVEIAAPSV